MKITKTLAFVAAIAVSAVPVAAQEFTLAPGINIQLAQLCQMNRWTPIGDVEVIVYQKTGDLQVRGGPTPRWNDNCGWRAAALAAAAARANRDNPIRTGATETQERQGRGGELAATEVRISTSVEIVTDKGNTAPPAVGGFN